MSRRVMTTLALCAALLVPAVLGTNQAGAVSVHPSAFPSTTDAESLLFTWLNGERTSRNLAPMVRSEKLDPYAASWSEFMASGGCVAREGTRLCHRTDLLNVANATYPFAWTKASENVGLVPNGGTLESLHAAFMKSTLHKMNVLDPANNAVGLSVRLDAAGTLFATYEFVAVKGDAANPPNPAAQLPPPPDGASPTDTFLLWINDARADAGLAPVARNAVLDREAQVWADQMAYGMACGKTVVLCHRKDMSTVAKTAVGPRGVRWWAENVGMRLPESIVSQFLGFMDSKPHRANILRKDINLVGIGYAKDPVTGRTFTVFDFVTARNAAASLPPGGNACGWVPSSISKGAKGPYVRTLQCALAAAGVYSGPINGIYNVDVANAVKAFQQLKGVKRPSTIATLNTRRWLGVV